MQTILDFTLFHRGCLLLAENSENMTRDERISKLKNGSDTAVWAAGEIERLDKELSDFLNPKNWTRPYTRKGELIFDHALYKPKLR